MRGESINPQREETYKTADYVLSDKSKFEKELNKKSGIDLFKKIKKQRISFFLPFKGLPRFYIRLLLLSFVCAAISGLTVPIFISFFGVMIKNIIIGGDVNDALLILVVVGICQYILCFISCLCVDIVKNKVVKTLRLNYLKSILYQDGEFHDNNSGSKLTSDLEFYLEQVSSGIGTKFTTIYTYAVSFLGLYLWSLFKNTRLTLCVTCVFPVIYIFGFICSRKIKLNRKMSLLYNNNTLSIIEEALVGIRTVVSNCGENIILKKFKLSEKFYTKFTLKANFFESLHIGAINGFLMCAYSFGFWYGTKILLHDYANQQSGDFHGGSVISILLGVLIAIFMLTIILPNITEYMKALEATNELLKNINRKPLVLNDNTGEILPTIKKITFKNVKFHYTTRKDVEVYKNLSFTLEEGKTYAFVGESGCGKSTILKLIERLYDPTEGDIIINDSHNLKNLNLRWWRSKIGVVTQEPLLFSNSIKNNIKYSLISSKKHDLFDNNVNNDKKNEVLNDFKVKNSIELKEITEYKSIPDSEVVNVSKRVLIHDFISSLPDKYGTLIGSNASKLSGGQKQRISIARAIIRNPEILILDEATSSLDNKSEYLVQKTINNLEGYGNRITIIIAHRLSTIRHANTIFVLSNRVKDGVDNNNSGSYIVEQGTHEELIKNKESLYYNMTQNQKISSTLDNGDKTSNKSSDYKESESSNNNKNNSSKNENNEYSNKGVQSEIKDKKKFGLSFFKSLCNRKRSNNKNFRFFI